MDGDGTLDVVISASGATGSLSGVIWLKGPGFTQRGEVSGPGGGEKWDNTILYDVDGDGDLDIVSTEQNTGLGAGVVREREALDGDHAAVWHGPRDERHAADARHRRLVVLDRRVLERHGHDAERLQHRPRVSRHAQRRLDGAVCVPRQGDERIDGKRRACWRHEPYVGRHLRCHRSGSRRAAGHRGRQSGTGASVSGYAPGVCTNVANTVVLSMIAHSLDSAGPIGSAPTNAGLTSVTEEYDAGTVTNDGGGLVIISGAKATAGTVAATTCTLTSTSFCSGTIAFKPAIATPYDVADTVTINGVAAADGGDIEVWDTIDGVLAGTTTISGGAGGFTLAVPYNDADRYRVVYDDGTWFGASPKGTAA
jgi:hypothetical protein